MTDTIDAVTVDEVVDQRQLAEQLLAQAKAQGVDLVGPGGLLNQITKRVLETALEAEMSEHLGYDKHEFVGRDGGNSRNGIRYRDGQVRNKPMYVVIGVTVNGERDILGIWAGGGGGGLWSGCRC